MYDFGNGLNIDKKFKSIYIFGGGISIDLFFNSNESKELSRDNAVIITCNGSISLLKPTIQICGDKHAIPYWAEHKNNDSKVIWIARPGVKVYNDCPVSYIKASQLIKRKYVGTGVEAFNIAYYIWHYHDIDSIYYIGYDFSDLIVHHSHMKQIEPPTGLTDGTKKTFKKMGKDKRKCYAARSEVMDYQLPLRAPKNWWNKRYMIKQTMNQCYVRQLKGLGLFVYDQKFMKILKCRSLLNIEGLNSQAHDGGYDRAIKMGYYNKYLK
jgi:hypothetical protein